MQCNSWVTTHNLQLLSSSAISLQCLWTPVLSAHVGRDFSGSLTPHYPPQYPLGPQENSHVSTIKLKCRPFPPWPRLRCRALVLQAASTRRESAKFTHAPWSRLWGSAGDKHPARKEHTSLSHCGEPQGMRGCSRQLFWADRQGRKGNHSFLLWILFEEVSSAMQILIARWWGDLWTGWPV